jgi:putative N6-adenine-specific DNA methylase
MRTTTARDILWIVEEGTADSLAKLKKKLAQVSWDFFLCPGEKWAVRATSHASRVFHEGLIKTCVQKELESRGCFSVLAKDADQRLDIRIDSDRFQIAISISGRFLYQRRYKSSFHSIAPLKEDLAAGIVRLGWVVENEAPPPRNRVHVWVPFAGSGTLAFETMLFLQKIAPEIFFGPLAAESFPCTPEASIKFARATLRSQWLQNKECRPHWHLVEMNAVQFESLKKNVGYFSGTLVSHNFQAPTITLEHNDFFDAASPVTAPGDLLFALFNPPYGERLGSKKEARKTYEKIGQILTNLPLDIELRGAILIPDPDSLRSFLANLKAVTTKEYTVRQGGKKITIVVFSRKSKHPSEPRNH